MSRQIVYSIEEMTAAIALDRPERAKPLAHEHRSGQRLGQGQPRLLAIHHRLRAAGRHPRPAF